jgi:hypothetical protein
MSKCSHHHSQHFYHASAFGVAGEIERPSRHTIPTQAATVLAPSGGRGYERVDNFHFDGIISFKSAYAEVGGSFDECHNRHTSYATAVIDGLNILDVVTADRVVSRLAIYSAEVGDKNGEATFDITGSHFVNLKVAGHKIDVKLATHIFHEHDTYSKVTHDHVAGKTDDWLLGSKFGTLKDGELAELEDTYHALGGMSELVREWKQKGNRPADRGSYPFSPANHLKLEDHTGTDTELRGFGSIICVPKFGLVRLAELHIQRHCRTFTMLRTQMCSTGTGGSDMGGTHGSGGAGSGGG